MKPAENVWLPDTTRQSHWGSDTCIPASNVVSGHYTPETAAIEAALADSLTALEQHLTALEQLSSGETALTTNEAASSEKSSS